MNRIESPIAVKRKIRWMLGIFMLLLVLSGLTAFPLLTELNVVLSTFGLKSPGVSSLPLGLEFWLIKVHEGLSYTYAHYPFLAYGTDWLAFSHIVIALFFIWPWMDPIRYVGVIYSGLIACILVIPLALICGPIREIPFYWQLIDCSFGVIGVFPLLYVLKQIKNLTGAHKE